MTDNSDRVMNKSIALVVVDMQKYYLYKESDYYKYFNSIYPGSLDYIVNNCKENIIPNINKLIQSFKQKNLPIFFLKLCSTKENREDLHPFFKKTHIKGKELNFENIYPMCNNKFSEIINELDIENGKIVEKQTFSAFTSTNFYSELKSLNIKTVVFTGLATSQCVETTARDASDRGFDVINIFDAQSDYDEETHNASIFASQGVCGGNILLTEDFLEDFKSKKNS